MSPKFRSLFREFVGIWRRWPRHLVLKASGVPVEIEHVEDREEGRRLVVSLPDGRRRTVAPDELESRPVLEPLYAIATVGLILAVLFGTVDRDPGMFTELLTRLAAAVIPAG